MESKIEKSLGDFDEASKLQLMMESAHITSSWVPCLSKAMKDDNHFDTQNKFSGRASNIFLNEWRIWFCTWMRERNCNDW